MLDQPKFKRVKEESEAPWQLRLSSLKNRVDSVFNRSKGLSLDHLARSRLEEQLEQQFRKNEALQEQLETSRSQYEGIFSEFNGLKSSASAQLSSLEQTCLELREQKEFFEREMSRLAAEVERMGKDQAKVLQGHARAIEEQSQRIQLWQTEKAELEKQIAALRQPPAANPGKPDSSLPPPVGAHPKSTWRKFSDWWCEPIFSGK